MADQNNDLVFRTNGEEKFRFSGDGPWKSQAPAKKLEIATNLSPASQSVLDAFRSSHTGLGCLAAALRAAVAHTQEQYVRDVWQCDADELLAIADELESQ